MDLSGYYKLYPTQKSCIEYLERIIWDDTPVCPYCNTGYNTPVPNERRKHCNTCNTSFSVTVKTMFHKTKVDLQKWFYAINLITNEKRITSRGLAEVLNITKDTANKMINAIKKEAVLNSHLIQRLNHG
jgi:transposase-like protein